MLERTMIRTAEENRSGIFRIILSALTAGILYLALFGSLSSMCGLSDLGLLPLSAGSAAALLLSILPLSKRTQLAFSGILLVMTLVLMLSGLPGFLDGCKGIMNRLFQASASRHPYIYETFSVSEIGTGGIAQALLILGLLIGIWIGTAVHSGNRVMQALPAGILFILIAWLGVSPSPVWLVLAAAACVLCLLRSDHPFDLTILIPAALLGFAVLIIVLAFPGRNETLSVWEESARDRLAIRTVYYGDLDLASEKTEQDPDNAGHSGKKPFYRRDEAEADEGKSLDWPHVLRLTALILLVLILLFGPAVWSDRLKRRRIANRAGLDDADAGNDIRASFLYGLRFLHEAGLISDNRPFSAYTEELLTVQEDFGRRFADVVSIWQEAAYSTHPMSEDKRRTVRGFRAEATALAIKRMNWKQKLRVRWFTAL